MIIDELLKDVISMFQETLEMRQNKYIGVDLLDLAEQYYAL
jgi:hypothetical protein